MREFVLLSRTSSNKIDLNNLNTGMWDSVARCVNSALWRAHSLRRAKIHVVLGAADQPRIVTVDNSIKRIGPDEKSIATCISKVMKKEAENPGIAYVPGSFQYVIKTLSKRKFYILQERGRDISKVEFELDPVIVLGDHIGLPAKDEAFVRRFDHEFVCVGPKSYLASQCISFINIELDRRGVD